MINKTNSLTIGHLITILKMDKFKSKLVNIIIRRKIVLSTKNSINLIWIIVHLLKSSYLNQYLFKKLLNSIKLYYKIID